MSCECAHQDAAYVLGALSPSERQEFEQHLPECGECSRAVREMAGLPGLLARVDETVFDSPTVQVPVPETLLPSLVHQVRRLLRRRVILSSGVAAAALVAVALVVLAISGPLSSDRMPVAESPGASTSSVPPDRAMVPVGDAPVRASVALEQVPWGTRLDLTCTYGPGPDQYRLPRAATYVLLVRTRDGSTQQVGTWRSLRGQTMRLTAATSASRADIASVEIQATNGKPVLRLRV